MSYKTILVHVSEVRQAEACINIAASIASAEKAHLIGVAVTGVSRFLYQIAESNPSDAVVVPHIEAMRKQADNALVKFDDAMRQRGLDSFERRLLDDDLASGVTQHARCCDLVVLPQYDPEGMPAVVAADLPAYVLMNSGCPVLVVPHAGAPAKVGERVLVAWNAGLEALRAVRDALPILKRAAVVEIAVFNAAARTDVYGEEPGADLALYLARHDVKVNVIQQTTEIDIGDALLSLAADLTSDLLVMGCYGHSRFREILLGGATRTVLDSMTVPVLMSH
ncbi:MAG: universal stress protein [Noviherbaspirillum sp.]